MDYYVKIKDELVNNEVYKKVKDYSKNKSDLKTYYNVGKLLSEAGKHYGDGIIEKYSKKLELEVGKKYNKRTLFRMRQFYILFKDEKVSPLGTQLTWTHFRELLSIKDISKINYYIKISEEQNLSVRQLRLRIKNNEYERLDDETRLKLITKENIKIEDFIKNPVLIKNKFQDEKITEKMLQQLILEDIPSFLKELGIGFSFIDNEYPIKIGNRYNYIDLLLFNIKDNRYTVVELKTTELKKEHIGQIMTYMNYVDENIKNINQNPTIGIIICRKDNRFIMKYVTNENILSREYELV